MLKQGAKYKKKETEKRGESVLNCILKKGGSQLNCMLYSGTVPYQRETKIIIRTTTNIIPV